MSVNEQIPGCPEAARTPLAMAIVLVAVSWLVVPASASAQGRDGFYLRGDFGDSDALTMRARIEGIDQPTRCDRLLYPDPAAVPRDPACSGVASGVFATVEFDRGAETMTSATALALGYARGRLRVEALQVAESTLGTNLIGGIAFEANERVSLVFRGRYSRYGDVHKPGKWDLVRSHGPVLADGRTPATFDLVLGDIAAYSATISCVYGL